MATTADLVNPRALHLATVVDALVVLHELGKDATKGTYVEGVTASQGRDLGRFVEACDAARDALFNVLNTGSSYVEHPSYRQAIDHYHSRREQAGV